LRLYPTSHVFGRAAKQECTVGKFQVRRGDNLLISQWAIQRSARHYDRPEEFRPERWTPEMSAKLHKFAYLPFGGGPRSCIGGLFATTEAKLILVTIARRFALDCVASADVRPDPAVTLRPVGGLPMVVRKRAA
jgi:cytochrome P450